MLALLNPSTQRRPLHLPGPDPPLRRTYPPERVPDRLQVPELAILPAKDAPGGTEDTRRISRGSRQRHLGRLGLV